MRAEAKRRLSEYCKLVYYYTGVYNKSQAKKMAIEYYDYIINRDDRPYTVGNGDIALKLKEITKNL